MIIITFIKLKEALIFLFLNDGNKSYVINGIENRIEQIIANLLDNAISFSDDNKNIDIKISKNLEKQIVINILDEGPGL
jgi:two-component system sensor histidine kinase ChvG